MNQSSINSAREIVELSWNGEYSYNLWSKIAAIRSCWRNVRIFFWKTHLESQISYGIDLLELSRFWHICEMNFHGQCNTTNVQRLMPRPRIPINILITTKIKFTSAHWLLTFTWVDRSKNTHRNRMLVSMLKTTFGTGLWCQLLNISF